MADRCAAEDPLLQILGRARDGDEASLAELLKLLLPTVRAWCLGRVRDPRLRSMVDDIVQETAIRIVRHLGSCRASSSQELAAWTLSIAHRESLRIVERGWIRCWVSLESAGAYEVQVGRADSEAPSNNPLADLLSDGYAALPDGTQKLLYLRIIEGWSWQEVAVEFETTASGAKRRFQRALARLRKHVLAVGSEAGPKAGLLLEKLIEQA